MNTLLKTRLPLKKIGEGSLVILLGTPEVELGEVVNIRDLSMMETYRDLFVREVIVTKIVNISQSILDAFGYTHFGELRIEVSERWGTALPAETEITVVVFGESDADSGALYFEELPDSVDDSDEILPLVYPGEDTEDTEEIVDIHQLNPDEE